MTTKNLTLIYLSTSLVMVLAGILQCHSQITVQLHDTYVVVNYLHYYILFGLLGLPNTILYFIMNVKKRKTVKLLDQIALVVHYSCVTTISILTYKIVYESDFNLAKQYLEIWFAVFAVMLGNSFLQIPNAIFSKKIK